MEKYGYKINPITDEIETPQIFLVNKKLEKLGELYPFENLEISINEGNQPDEVSFTYYKMANNQECSCFNKLNDLSVIQVGDFGFFECEIGKQDNVSVFKTVSGKSLGFAELSQILHTLEVNTEADIARTDYDKDYPTIFYRDIPLDADSTTERKLCESSLLHRILTKAPHYKIGYVAPTLKHIQRTFSWSDTDIVSILNDISEEITCLFDIQVRIDEEGKAERLINFYDMQYCEKCWENAKKEGQQASSNTVHFRNIVNGVCQNCGSSQYVADIGEDSGIYISTEYLSDDIVINGEKDSIKNCLKITGGDDIMTATVQGLNMSATNRIIEFSDLQRKEMSDKLVERLDKYKSDYNSNSSDYEALLETEYNLHDIRLYLQSEKMPQIEKEITTTDEALYSVLDKIQKYFNNKFYISSYETYYNYPSSSSRTSIYYMFTTFMPEGYTLAIQKSNTEEDVPTEKYKAGNMYGWYGSIKIHRTDNRDDSYTLHVTKQNGTYVTSGTGDKHYISSNKTYQDLVDGFRICFYFADQSQQEYKAYLESYTAYLLTTVNLTYENEQKKEWDKYSYHLLQSFHDGYQKCIDTIDEMLRTNTAGTGPYKILLDMRGKYVSICNDISLQMNVLEDQIFAVCYYLGGDYSNNYLNDKGDVVYNYKFYKGNNKANIQDIFNRMINPNYAGGYNEEQTKYTPNEYIGNKPFKCLKCNSSNVAVSTEGNVCRNHGCEATGEQIYTYCDIMKNIAESYQTHNGSTITDLRTEYQNRFEMKTYFGEELYAEMCSFIREDVYNNSNFTSDGLSNSQIIQQAKELRAKAQQELAKACRPQYVVTAPLCSIVAQIDSAYSEEDDDPFSLFKINNYVRVRIDKDLYKMRITSFRLPFPISDRIDVTFSNVSNCKTNTAQEVKDILDNAVSIATNISYVATQAEKGEVVSTQFSQIKEEGLNAALVAVKNGRDQDVVIDGHGILLRKKIQETGDYSNYQMRIINRNIVMTSDNWQTASLAIGLGMYNGKPVYGMWTELLCGNLLVGEKLNISNDNGSVEITGDGITLDGGAITWTNKAPIDSIKTEYMTSSSGTNTPSADNSNWSDSIPDITDGKYLWCKTTTTDAAGESAEPEIVCLGGSDNIEETWIEYAFSEGKDNENEPNDTSWFKEQPTYSEETKDLYIWTRTAIKYMSGKITYTDVAYNSAITNSILSYNEFKDNVHTVLGISGTTTITKDSVISPKIAAQYLYVTKDNYSVEIDPSHSAGDNTLNGYLFIIRDKSKSDDEQVIMGVDTSGNGYFSGEINATSGYIGGKTGWTIDGTTIINKSGDAVIQTGDGSTFTKITQGSIYTSGRVNSEAPWQKVRLEKGIIFCERPYSDSKTSIDSYGIQQLGTNGEVWLDTNTDTDTIILGQNSTTIGMVGNTTFHRNMYLSPNNYLYSTEQYNGINISMLGMNNNRGLYLGMYYYDGSHHPDYLNSIILSSQKTEVLGTLIAKDGTVVTSDARYKTDVDLIEQKEVDFILGLTPKKFKLTDGTSGRYHYGFIAQDVETLMDQTIGDVVGLLVKREAKPEEAEDYVPIDFQNEETFQYGLRYEEFIAPMVKTIQHLNKEIKELKKELSAYKACDTNN